MDYAENIFLGNIPHLVLITLLCIKRGVKVAKYEEKIPKAFPLTHTRVLKVLVEGEKVERIEKRKKK